MIMLTQIPIYWCVHSCYKGIAAWVVWPCLSTKGKESHNVPWNMSINCYSPLMQARITVTSPLNIPWVLKNLYILKSSGDLLCLKIFFIALTCMQKHAQVRTGQLDELSQATIQVINRTVVTLQKQPFLHLLIPPQSLLQLTPKITIILTCI